MTTAHPGVYMQSRRKAILCLCYDINVLQVRRMLLERFGYIVLPTTSVDDAKHMAEDQCPDMLIMDNSDPGIDFEQLGRQVKEACPELITVVLSSYGYGSRNGTGSIDHVVDKGEGPDALISQIGELFGEAGEESQAVFPQV
ncbi:MAG TPA: hypothetical protein VL240_06855 [Candidatus Binatia bacterium]|nr:hypothetical protein [Candidatus Binatia bacterium]